MLVENKAYMIIKWYCKLVLSLALIHIGVIGIAQNNLKYRFSVNTGMFLNEGNATSIPDPSIFDLVTPGGVDGFKTEFKPGFELEISVPVFELFSIGLEFENHTLKGVNENPIYYNYFATQQNYVYSQQPLMYTTYLNNLIGNVRYYPIGIRTFQPFVKVFGGVSFVGTNLQFYNPQDQVDIFNPLYARGTQLSTETRWPAFYFGTGIGFELHLTELISFYVDASFSVIETNIVDGVPNFTYNEITGINEHFNSSSFVAQFSAGICYAIYRPSKDSDPNSAKIGLFKKRKGKIDKYFPFHEIKKPF